MSDWRILANLTRQFKEGMKPKPSLGGFSNFFTLHGRGKQRDYLHKAIARLANEFPDGSPRTFILEYLSEEIYIYERHLERLAQEELNGKSKRFGEVH